MVSARPRVARVLLSATAAAALSGCGAAVRTSAGSVPVPPALRQALGSTTAVHLERFPPPRAVFEELGTERALIVGGDGWRPPLVVLDEAHKTALLQFLHGGGRLLLLGHACRLVHDLGIETHAPDVWQPYRWGFDGRTALGRAQLGFELVSGRLPELAADMQSAPGNEHAFFVTGGEPLCTPLSLWLAAGPARGEVLGRLHRACDGQPQSGPGAVLALWRHGRGQVLALGLEPDPGSGVPELARNAAAFLANALRWLGGGQPPPRLGYWLLPSPTAPAPDRLMLPEQRAVPGAPLLSHWGWEAPAFGVGEPESPERVRDDVLLASFTAGATALSLQLVDPERGLPLPWPQGDPLRRPPSYRGDAFAPRWQQSAIGQLAAEAHARGMMLWLGLDPLPAAGSSAERLATLRFLARELADLRRLGSGAVDGLAVREWFADPQGLGPRLLQDFQPAAAMLAVGETVPEAAGAVRGLDARDGRPGALFAFGVGAGYRDGFPGDLFPLGVLDATARRAPQTASGGSFGDWIALQAAEFVRQRLGRGAAMLWRAHDPATLAPDTIEYVHGVSAEPLTAAVAARCTTTGIEGWRDAQRALLPEIQRGFGAVLPVPAATVLLQNNRLRLLGSGGQLAFDPSGLASFAPEQGGVVLAREFWRTRLFGARPDAEELRSPVVDLLAGGRRGEGGHGLSAAVAPGGPAPQQLAFGAAPQWPQRCDFALPNDIGRFELQVALRPIAGRGVVAIGEGGEPLWHLPFEAGRLCIERVLPLQLARGAGRVLQLEVVDGGAVAIERLVLQRVGDLGAEARPVLRAGALAKVEETSASSYHSESVELTAVADFPGLLLRIECQRAVRGLQVERRFGLLRHRRLRESGGGDGQQLRTPFVLAADDEALPDLLVVPLQLGRYEHFTVGENGLLLVNRPESGAVVTFGCWLLPREQALRALPFATEVFHALALLPALPNGRGGTAELHSALGVAWPRILRLETPCHTPCLVRENGWWTWRGVQSTSRGQFVRVLHLPRDTVQVVHGPAVLARTRPGPGAAGTVALRDPAPDSVTVAVLQESPFSPPSVTMAADFDAVTIDGEPWHHYRGRTIFLPPGTAVRQVLTRRHGGARAPHVQATQARLEHCAFHPERRELVLVARSEPGRPSALPFTAVLAGPRPRRIDGGELVDDAELRHAAVADRAAAAAGGTLIRFRPGLVRVFYGE